ncbi:hypothetical protein PBCVFr5L_142L [Paramecium bursaria Chlorella virus Fr5L]|jgi:hypothetical protein|nr:hypothetical protein PBCVCZ2_111L [Paramecium bursaria Chlorella virus CZ-2]AGE53086.1 hypothetical protein PBCVFr5L_142L [Paramecium bursaria Chlorella virus Fr5L]AGE58981.1 hypothetical protein PBCVOR070422_110L [Paramecium bursaria Chlorella virus OR0704.2.2]
MSEGIVFFVAETYKSNIAKIGYSTDTNIKKLYDNTQSMRLPSIIAFYSIDVVRDELLILRKLKENDLLLANNMVKNANDTIDIFTGFFKEKLSNEPPQVIDETTKRMIDKMLADSDDGE